MEKSTTLELPLEWKRIDTHHCVIYDATGMVIADRIRDVPAENYRPAQDIVRACNQHEELVEALRCAKQWMDFELGGMVERANVYRMVEAALTKAGVS